MTPPTWTQLSIPPVTKERWSVAYCRPDSYEVDYGTSLPCCGCALTTLAGRRGGAVCSCRCHESANRLDRTAWRRDG